MTTRHVQKLLNPRNRGTSLDQEREHYKKLQIHSIYKAINNVESPVKEKHVRRIIIDSFRDKSTTLFWTIVTKLALQENPIVCWKFCHVLHKLLREGHRKAIEDAYPYCRMLTDISKLWGLLKDGYGKLIHNYCTLLVNKIEFHKRNTRFPGNLQITDEELDNIGEADVNILFQLSCEMFDYLDEILCLQSSVFGSLDMSRANSMTTSGQCRLAPLIPCIQDSSHLYDYSVKVLFKLHAALPPATLEGHRNRFAGQFKILKSFYINSSNLQYFRHLIQIPLLPNNPTNFLRASDLQSHVTPVVILPQHADSPDGSDAVDTLIDLSFPSNQNESKSDESQSLYSFQSESCNGSGNTIDSTDTFIKALKTRINELEAELESSQNEKAQSIQEYRNKLAKAKCNSIESERIMKSIVIDKENAIKKCEELKQELEQLKAGTATSNETLKSAEKLAKFKEVYNQLRQEHIELLRSKAESDKSVVNLKSSLEHQVNCCKDLEKKLNDLKSKSEQFNDLQSQVEELNHKLSSLEALNDKMKEQCNTLNEDKEKTDGELQKLQEEISKLTLNSKEQLNNFIYQLNEKNWHFMELILSVTAQLAKKLIEDAEYESFSANIFSTPEHFFSQCDLLKDKLQQFCYINILGEQDNQQFDEMLKWIVDYYHFLSHSFHCAKVIYNTLPNIEIGQELMNLCKNLISLSINMNDSIIKRLDIEKCLEDIKNCIQQIISMKLTIIPQLIVDHKQNLEELLNQEMQDMDRAISEAVKKLEQLMVKSKAQDTGVKLEVNENILDACTNLMKAIVELVDNSKELQNEIIMQGKGTASNSEFYQRNHRWTEGLISASKVVALAAKLLVEAADKVIKGEAKFEELMVASNEISAATAQLVVASRVKAEKKSFKLINVSKSSKSVKDAAGNVVAISMNYAQKSEESETDFSKLTLHQAKKMEMESQVRVLELENELTKERMRLSCLRKRHYHLGDNKDEN